MTKHKKEAEFEEISKFQRTVMDVSGRLQKLPSSMGPRQEFINFTASQLYELQATADLWRKYYRTANFAVVIAVCCKYFREQIADEENETI